jgi:hypothetical protein
MVFDVGRAGRVKRRRRVFDRSMSRRRARANEDVVEEGVWLSADSMNRLLFKEFHGGKAMSETLWKCDQLRAGQLYNRMMFDTQAEAKKFAEKMQQMEPDQIFSIEAIHASQVWN